MADFLDSARIVTFESPEVRGVRVTAGDAEFARALLDRHVISGLTACKELLNTEDAFLRVWLGGPNLRMHVATLTRDEDVPANDLKRIAELGTAIANSYRGVSARFGL